MEIIREKQKQPGMLAVGSMLIILLLAIGMMMLIALTVGSADFTISELFRALFIEEERTVHIVLFNLRLPRILLAIIIGACLAVSGVLLQAVMRNPLADPGTIGVSAGAGTAAITILLLFPNLTGSVPLFAFVGAIAACVLIYIMAWKDGIHPVRIILAGVAINSVLGAYNSLLQMMNADNLQGVLSFMNGSLSGKSWEQVSIAATYGLIGLVLAVCCVKSANALQLGEEMAKSLGFNVSKHRIVLSAVAAFLAAISVSVVGMIGFVGLIVPHIARLIVGSNYKILLPVSTLLGSLVLLVADTIGRTVIEGMEIPVGIVMAVVGGPFFLYMLKKKGMGHA